MEAPALPSLWGELLMVALLIPSRKAHAILDTDGLFASHPNHWVRSFSPRDRMAAEVRAQNSGVD